MAEGLQAQKEPPCQERAPPGASNVKTRAEATGPPAWRAAASSSFLSSWSEPGKALSRPVLTGIRVRLPVETGPKEATPCTPPGCAWPTGRSAPKRGPGHGQKTPCASPGEVSGGTGPARSPTLALASSLGGQPTFTPPSLRGGALSWPPEQVTHGSLSPQAPAEGPALTH